jgi:uncharacterized protein with HEPN domain
MRREALYLSDIVDAADAAARFVEGMDREAFLADELRQSATLQKLIVIGEAASRLPSAFREEHRQVEWQDVIGFRNIAVHAYFAVSWEIVWVTATEDVPELRDVVALILAEEYTEE